MCDYHQAKQLHYFGSSAADTCTWACSQPLAGGGGGGQKTLTVAIAPTCCMELCLNCKQPGEGLEYIGQGRQEGAADPLNKLSGGGRGMHTL